MKTAYEDFWKRAQGKNFETQLQIWDEEVESKYQDFFDSLVWSKKFYPNWSERRSKRLKELFANCPHMHLKIIACFAEFSASLNTQINSFQSLFPDAKFTLPIFTAIGTTFNGKVGSLEGSPEQLVLAFGIDTIVERGDDQNILCSHELFHIYHVEKMGVTEAVFKSARLTLPLWLEGFATYASGVLNPGASESDLLMDSELGQLASSDLPWLAKTFLDQCECLAHDEKSPQVYLSWFGIGEHKVRKDLPNRCGYLLGLKLVNNMAKRNNLAEMAHWSPEQVHSEVKMELKNMAASSVQAIRD